MEEVEKMKMKKKGKQRIKIERIECKTKRCITFTKRRNDGVFKKAKELSSMCGAQVGVITFSSAGKLFLSPNSEVAIHRFIHDHDHNNIIIGDGDGDHSVSSCSVFGKENNDGGCCKKVVDKEATVMISESRRSRVNDDGDENHRGFWWDQDIEGLGLVELERFKAALEGLRNQVAFKIDHEIVTNTRNISSIHHHGTTPPILDPQDIDVGFVDNYSNNDYYSYGTGTSSMISSSVVDPQAQEFDVGFVDNNSMINNNNYSHGTSSMICSSVVDLQAQGFDSMINNNSYNNHGTSSMISSSVVDLQAQAFDSMINNNSYNNHGTSSMISTSSVVDPQVFDVGFVGINSMINNNNYGNAGTSMVSGVVDPHDFGVGFGDNAIVNNNNYNSHNGNSIMAPSSIVDDPQEFEFDVGCLDNWINSPNCVADDQASFGDSPMIINNGCTTDNHGMSSGDSLLEILLNDYC